MQIKKGDKFKVLFADSIKEVEVKEIYKVGDKTKIKVKWWEFIFPFTYEYDSDWFKNRVEEARRFEVRQHFDQVEI